MRTTMITYGSVPKSCTGDTGQAQSGHNSASSSEFKCDPQRCHEISLLPKKGGPFGLTVVASAAVRITTCRSRCRLSTLRTHSVRTKAVSSSCVVCMGVNGAMREEQHNNRHSAGSPAVERP